MKSLSLLLLILAYISLAQSNTCKVDSQQNFTIFNRQPFKEHVQNDTLELNTNFRLDANLPQPKKNALIKFKLQASNYNGFIIFANNQNKEANTITSSFRLLFPNGAQEVYLIFYYGDQYVDIRSTIDTKYFHEPKMFAVYFQKDFVSLYYDNYQLGLKRLHQSEKNHLNMFSSYDTDAKLNYQLYQNLHRYNFVKMQDLHIFNDVNEEQKRCLLYNQDQPQIKEPQKFLSQGFD